LVLPLLPSLSIRPPHPHAELSHALYQHDAACRVIARLTRERDQARQALAMLNPSGSHVDMAAAAATSVAAGTTAAATDDAEEMDVDGGDGMSAAVLAAINKTNKTLSKGRKKRAKSATLATHEEIAALAEKWSQVCV
jgi:pre-mRNA-processing factor 19